VARLGQPWSEAKAMDPVERRAFLYANAVLAGHQVDWDTGRIIIRQQG